ncbi:MAG: ABC transporter ATP-binding protein [Muribaculaceae bacterium]|nr:ABC transporter ATP-binding protein [Muribaculaceae bacterium]
MNAPLLRTSRLTVGYRADKPLLEDLDLELGGGRIAVLIGGNGAGKSTLLRTLAGSLRPLAGSISIAGTELRDLSKADLAKQLAIVTTDRTMAGGLTVEETVAIGRHPYTGIFGRLSSRDRAIVREAMEATGIAEKAKEPLGRLSDGERQKAMIARAVAQQTPLMLMDEPTSFLDVAARIDTMALLRRLTDASGGRMSILLSSHDVGPALEVADEVWVFDPAIHTLVCGSKDEMIGSGAMELPFAGRGIVFDIRRGDYSSYMNKQSE